MKRSEALKGIRDKIPGLLFLLTGVFPGIPSAYANPLTPGNAQDSIIVDTIQTAGLNPEKGIAVLDDQLVLSSNSKYQQKMIADHVPFGQEGTYLAPAERLSDLPYRMFIAKDPFAVDPSGISADMKGDMICYTAPVEPGSSILGIFSGNLSESTKPARAGFELTGRELLPFCSKEYSHRHPAFSAGGDFMIFASDRPGSAGGYDLFIVSFQNGQWGEPQSLGTNINTSGEELYPFMDKTNNLYFSSSGHSGLGGLDIYMCKFSGDGWERPVNLLSPINSSKDETGFKLSESAGAAWLTASTPGGHGDLYQFSLNNKNNISEGLLNAALETYRSLYDQEIVYPVEKKTALTVKTAPAPVLAQGPKPPAKEKQEVTGETVKQEPAVKPAEEKVEKKVTEPVEKPEPEIAEKKAEEATKPKEELIAAKTEETKPVREEAKVVEAAPPPPEPVQAAPEEEKDVVYFRVQITSSSKANPTYTVKVDGTSYPTFQYLYKGAYRFTVGNFRDLDEAKAFQARCRASGFEQAFVAAFINDERVTDPSVFR